ncbi:hypothetical protein [Limosilactobacillus walteri]|uniref:Uncharacterized protein n=1 Tax=Limosilactobacillus walteri TaxID=2268022 RepID=A0ABR8P8I7_9LACO|nr:hypothetical protein [Limosilactobacillus walteri]MBD5807002.1 hypothetical protein [Limosilactobacillus walteri]
MSGVNTLSRSFKTIIYKNDYYLNLTNLKEKYGFDALFISDDSEWDTSKNEPSENNEEHRYQSNIISHQYVLKFGQYPAMGIVIFRQPDDKLFSFWDLIKVIRYYLNYVGYGEEYNERDYSRLSKQLGIKKDKIEAMLCKSKRVPPIVWTGFFSGVDITAYYDWKKYLDIQGKSKNEPTFIALNKQEFFSNPYSILVTNPNSRRIKYPLTIKFVDTMALGPQGGLAALGSIVGQKKLNTKKWDLEDKLISFEEFNDPYNGGYYKSHMRFLLNKRLDDYINYALGDSEVTLKYLDFFMGNVIDVYNEGLIENIHIPATLTSLADEISSHYSKEPYDEQTVANIYQDIFRGINVDQYLRPRLYNQDPPKDTEEWIKVLNDAVDGYDNFAFQKLFVKKLKPYFARGTLTYKKSKKGYIYQKLIGSAPTKNQKGSTKPLADRINFKKLYEDNPEFDVSNLSNQRIKVSKPKFVISTKLRNQYADHAHQFNFTRNNVPPTIDNVLIKLNNASVYSTVPWFNKKGVICWTPEIFLTTQLNFDQMRKGYNFIEPRQGDKKHKKGSHDQFSVHPDDVYNDGFNMAKQAYVGGMNLAFNPGIITIAFKYKYDIDLKSSYVDAGLLIPDFRLDCKPILDTHDLDSRILRNYHKYPRYFVNGPFTLGVANVSYHFPDNIKRVPVGYKPLIKDQGPIYVRQANRVNMTVTDVINIIEHGGTVEIHRIIIPQQKTLDGDVTCLAPIGKMQHWSLIRRNEAKAKRDEFDSNSDEYRKYDALQLFYKLLGNGGYGKSGQGLGTGGTRDFLTGNTMYVPFSRNTNPFTAAQYTSIARYQVNALMDLVEETYPNSLIPSITTDGFIFCSNNLLEEETIRTKCEKCFDKNWVLVNKKNFSGQFFELKSHNHGQKYTTTALINIRTRFNMTEDNHIKALVGLQPNSWTTARLIKLLETDTVTFKVDDFRMQSINDMKHSIDNKRYVSMKTWKQSKWLNLSPDDTYELIDFVPQGNFGYYLTRPFASIEELMTYRNELKNYRSLFPVFRREYAKQFIKFDQSVRDYGSDEHSEKHVTWVKNDVYLKGKNYPELIDNYRKDYVQKVMIRYLANHPTEYNLNLIYKRLFHDRYKEFKSFNRALKRNKGQFVNPLCVLKENITDTLKTYQIVKQIY